MRVLLILTALLAALGAGAAAQPAATALGGSGAAGEGLCWLPRGAEAGLAEWVRGSGQDRLVVQDPQQTSHARATLGFEVRRPDGLSAEQWRGTLFAAIIYPGAGRAPPSPGVPVHLGYVQPPSPGGEVTTIRAEFLPPETWWPRTWQMAIIACDGPTGAPRLFGLTEVSVSSYGLSVLAGLGSAVLLYLLLGLAARRVHARQLESAAAGQPTERRGPAWLRAFNPVVICQDAFGSASLSRFQVLLFTLAVVGVYAYVLVRTGQLSALSSDVLVLLGITLAGSTLAGLAEGPVLSAPNRLWLFATGVLDGRPRRPAWQDLLGADGEIDVTRVQALAFSAFAAIALVWYGASDLERFAIPPELNTLIGLSQVVYVAGRALPREVGKRLNEEVRLLRDAERDCLANPADEVARLAFERARTALQTSLFDVFGDRFRPGVLRALQPGGRMEPPPASAGVTGVADAA